MSTIVVRVPKTKARTWGCAVCLIAPFFVGLALIPYFLSVDDMIDECAPSPPSTVNEQNDVYINDLIIQGTHNSYNTRYHADIQTQFTHNSVRSLELDLHYNGYNTFSVFHTLFDAQTSCGTLEACLEQIHAWSSANPRHVPLWIFLEPKFGFERASPFDTLETSILRWWCRNRIVTPADVQGDASSMRESLQRGNAWPRLSASRGKVAFVLLDKSSTREKYRVWGRARSPLLFIVGDSDADADAAILSYVDSVKYEDKILSAVEAGYVVRSRTEKQDPYCSLWGEGEDTCPYTTLNTPENMVEVGVNVISSDVLNTPVVPQAMNADGSTSMIDEFLS